MLGETIDDAVGEAFDKAAKILGLPGTLPEVRATAGFVEGFSYALWAFGTWWMPLLVILGFWRHVRQR